ncbi:MAG: HupE/UreJ family protein [Deltaproteobacteria bacterium]
MARLIGTVRLRHHSLAVLSSMVLVALTWMCAQAQAHEVQPSIADVTVSRDEVTLVVRTRLEAIVAGIDQGTYTNTNDAPQAAEYDRLRALSADELRAAVLADQARLMAGIKIDAGAGPVAVELLGLDVPEVGDVDVGRESTMTVRAVLPVGDAAVTIAWDATYGSLVLRQTGGGDDAYTAYLAPGEVSLALPRGDYRTASALASFGNFIVLGFTHILPKGLDHILFVLGLFLFSLRWRPLLTQVTAFTLAHTVTLALATLKIVTVPTSIVEPLIALSIAWVAVENILWQKLTIWRTLVVFCFGLLHGLGFASVLGEIGLTPSRFFTGLIGFNIGVELGQLTIISAAYLLVARWFGDKPWYRQVVVIPASLAIAAMGLFWAYERVFLA